MRAIVRVSRINVAVAERLLVIYAMWARVKGRRGLAGHPPGGEERHELTFWREKGVTKGSTDDAYDMMNMS